MEDLGGIAVAARGIHKRYGGITALNDVSLEVLAGEIHALVGENGAGKSTLVKIMTGAETPDGGELSFFGEPAGALTPEKAQERGIGAVYQEPSLVPGLTVLENMFLGRELRSRLGLLARKEMKHDAQEALDRVGANIRLGKDVAGLSVAERQLVEIARALAYRAKLLIFDEPSAILSGAELDRVFAVIEELRASGLGILYISHRLAEIFRLADRATVLKDGRVVTTRSVEGLTTDELIRLMVGRDIGERPARKPPGDRVVLEARELALRPDSEPVSFELRSGEVLGVAGLIGSSRSRLASALGGVRPARSGTILRNGRPVSLRRPRDAVRAGIVVIPEDRKGEGLILAQSIRANVGLASLDDLATFGVVRGADEKRLAVEAVRRFGIRPPTSEVTTRNLSGGNQQKVVLSKWLVRKPPPEVAILDEPTRGVDVGAKFEIYRLIDELVAGGAGVLLISSELPEVIAMSDRIIVMSNGQIAGTLEPHEFSEERILTLAVLGRESGDGAHNLDHPAEIASAPGYEKR
jgi:ABC-type sugar transport system ATPase subunit